MLRLSIGVRLLCFGLYFVSIPAQATFQCLIQLTKQSFPDAIMSVHREPIKPPTLWSIGDVTSTKLSTLVTVSGTGKQTKAIVIVATLFGGITARQNGEPGNVLIEVCERTFAPYSVFSEPDWDKLEVDEMGIAKRRDGGGSGVKAIDNVIHRARMIGNQSLLIRLDGIEVLVSTYQTSDAIDLLVREMRN